MGARPMRVEIKALLSLSLLGLLAACPPPSTTVGDLPLGEYDLRATQTVDDCVIGDVLQDGDFDFRVRLSGLSGTDEVYMVVSVPPAYAEQVSVKGIVEAGQLVFAGENATSLPACTCSPLVNERFVFVPLTSSADGGGGGSDGGTSGDGGSDGGMAPDGGSALDAGTGEVPDGGDGVSGLPLITEIVGMGGSLSYAVDTAPDCQARDTDAGTGCTLPCEIQYLLAGTVR